MDDINTEENDENIVDDYNNNRRRGLFGFGNKKESKPMTKRSRGGKRSRRNRGANHRPVVLYAPVYNGLAAALSVCMLSFPCHISYLYIKK